MSTAKIIDGAMIAHDLRVKLAKQVSDIIKQENRAPCLAVILAGDNPASEIYVKHKSKACKEVGIFSVIHRLEQNCSDQELLSLIDKLNQDNSVDGILLQLPVPSHITQDNLLERINPKKDVDGFHPYNIGRLAQRRPAIRPCTPCGVMYLLTQINCDFKNSHAVIIGSSNIVGRPMALELLLAGSTVTVCHKFTQDLPSHVRKADIVISAVGKPELIKGEWIKPGAIVIDVAMCRLDDGSLTGDVEFEQAIQKASYITPVPGGVGPMTVAMLLRNTLECYLSSLSSGS